MIVVIQMGTYLGPCFAFCFDINVFSFDFYPVFTLCQKDNVAISFLFLHPSCLHFIPPFLLVLLMSFKGIVGHVKVVSV